MFLFKHIPVHKLFQSQNPSLPETSREESVSEARIMAPQDTSGRATESEHLISIEMQEQNRPLTTSIQSMLDGFSHLPPDCSLFRAPKRFRQLNEKVFDPLIVSIGPYHHGKENLQTMEMLKVGYLDAFLARARTNSEPKKINLETCVNLIKQWEDRIKNCYAETIKFDSDGFVKMILLDSCFVIEVIWRYNNINYREEVTDHLSHLRIQLDVALDMILLENQLPFFVLQGLYDLAFPIKKDNDTRFIDHCAIFVGRLSFSADVDLIKSKISKKQPSEVKHLLDLLRMLQAPSIGRKPQSSSTETETTMRKATELDEAGMVIRPYPKMSSVTDIRYEKGILEIPKLTVYNTVELVLRNLIALEWCLYNHESYISDYVHFMDNLIDTSKDVELLIRNGVIESSASDSTAVANLFNNLRPYCLKSKYLYYGIQQEINDYCKVPWHKWRATLRRDYCSSPWIIGSTVAAMILLILTAIQTVCSIISIT